MNQPIIQFAGKNKSWLSREIQDIATINPRCQPLPEQFVYIDLESVESGRLLKEEMLKKDDAPSRAQRLLSKGDVLFQMVRPYQGNNLHFKKDGVYVASTGYAQLHAKSDVDPEFLYQLLHTASFSEEVMNRCTGSSYPAINSSSLASIKVNVPELAEQQKIASFLNAIDTRIDQLTQKHALLVEYKKGVMQKVFSQEVRFKDENGNEFSPWMHCALGEITHVVMGQSPNSSSYNTDGDGLPLIQGNADISGRKTIIRSWTNEAGKVCKAGDIILTVRAPVGSVAKASFDSCLGRGVCALQVKKEYSRDFIFQMLFWFEEFRWRSVSQGAIFDAINGNDIKGLDVEIPSMQEQIKIATFLGGLDALIESALNQMTEAKSYKQGLLQAMFV
jgi:type I restriction enzyme S subunit